MALEPDITDYRVVFPKERGDGRGTRPFIAMEVGGRYARQFTADSEAAAVMFDAALKRAQAVVSAPEG